jgi:hypothetical protein
MSQLTNGLESAGTKLQVGHNRLPGDAQLLQAEQCQASGLRASELG